MPAPDLKVLAAFDTLYDRYDRKIEEKEEQPATEAISNHSHGLFTSLGNFVGSVANAATTLLDNAVNYVTSHHEVTKKLETIRGTAISKATTPNRTPADWIEYCLYLGTSAEEAQSLKNPLKMAVITEQSRTTKLHHAKLAYTVHEMSKNEEREIIMVEGKPTEGPYKDPCKREIEAQKDHLRNLVEVSTPDLIEQDRKTNKGKNVKNIRLEQQAAMRKLAYLGDRKYMEICASAGLFDYLLSVSAEEANLGTKTKCQNVDYSVPYVFQPSFDSVLYNDRYRPFIQFSYDDFKSNPGLCLGGTSVKTISVFPAVAPPVAPAVEPPNAQNANNPQQPPATPPKPDATRLKK